MHEEVSETENTKEKNEDDVLLDWLSSDRKEAEARLVQIRKSLIFRFRSFNEPEDLADEVIYRTYKKLKEGKADALPGYAEHYISRVATHVKQEKLRERKLISLGEKIIEPTAAETGNSFPEKLFKAVEKCLGQLPLEEKTLLLDYLIPRDEVSVKEYRERLSKQLGISITHLRVKISRLKDKVRECAEARMQEENSA